MLHRDVVFYISLVGLWFCFWFSLFFFCSNFFIIQVLCAVTCVSFYPPSNPKKKKKVSIYGELRVHGKRNNTNQAIFLQGNVHVMFVMLLLSRSWIFDILDPLNWYLFFSLQTVKPIANTRPSKVISGFGNGPLGRMWIKTQIDKGNHHCLHMKTSVNQQ